MTDRAWNNQGGSNRDGFNFKPYKPKRKQNVPPFDELKESLITSFKIVKPRRPKPDYGEFGDAVWIFEFYDDDLDLKEPQITVPGIYEPRISTPSIPKADPDVSAENIFPYAIEDEYELIVKYDNGIILTILSGQAYAARNQINDPKFDLAIVIKSSVSISIEGVPGTVGVVVLANSPQNPVYSLYNWLITKIAIATDYSALNPDPILSGLQFRDNTIQLPTTQFTNGADTYSLFYADGLQPKQICLNAINKLLYFQPSDIPGAIDDYRMWWVTYAGEILPLCLNIDGEPIVPIISIAFAPGSPTQVEAGSGGLFVIRISIDSEQLVNFAVNLGLSGTANPLFYTTNGISTSGGGDRFVTIPESGAFIDVSIEPLENVGEVNIKTVIIELLLNGSTYDINPLASAIQADILPRIIVEIIYRYLFVWEDGSNLKLGGYNDTNSTINLIAKPNIDGNSAYNNFALDNRVYYGLNTIEPSSVDWNDIDPYEESAIDPTGYTQMYWRFTWIEFDDASNTALVKYFRKDNAITQTPIIEYINPRFPHWVGGNTWQCKITTGLYVVPEGSPDERFLFDYLEDFYLFDNNGSSSVSASDAQCGRFARGKTVQTSASPPRNTRHGYTIREVQRVFDFTSPFFPLEYLYDPTHDIRYLSRANQPSNSPPFDNLWESVLAYQPDLALYSGCGSTLNNNLSNNVQKLYAFKIEGTISNEIASTVTYNIPTVQIFDDTPGDGVVKYDITVDVPGNLTIRGAVDLNLSGIEQIRFDVESYSSAYSKRTVLIANQLNLIKTESFDFQVNRTIEVFREMDDRDVVSKYYCYPLKVDISIEPIGQTVKLTNTHIDVNIPEIDNNTGDLVVNFSAGTFIFKKKYVSELTRRLITAPGSPQNTINISNKYTFAATPLWEYINDIASGFFTIVTNSTITNVRSVSVNSTATSSLQTNYEQQRYSMSLAPNDPVEFVTPTWIQAETNTFFGLDFGVPLRTNTQIDAIFYNVLSTYAHAIPTLLPAGQVRIIFVGQQYFTPQDTIVTKARATETGVAARLYKSRKSSANTGIVENWAVMTDGRIELQAIVKSPIGIFAGDVSNAYFYPGMA